MSIAIIHALFDKKPKDTKSYKNKIRLYIKLGFSQNYIEYYIRKLHKKELINSRQEENLLCLMCNIFQGYL